MHFKANNSLLNVKMHFYKFSFSLTASRSFQVKEFEGYSCLLLFIAHYMHKSYITVREQKKVFKS